MNQRIKLPEIFEGTWEHLLVLTYGAEIPFFENALLRSSGFRCRNKVILADGNRFLESCKGYAENKMLRFMNRKYVADGIFVPHAAHAKLILLLREDNGLMLVGSGNLSRNGYTSGGELFTSYNYSPEEKQDLPAFQSVWKFVLSLINKGWVGKSAIPFLEMMSETHWLFHSVESSKSSITQNLDVSFFQQLQNEIQKDKVDELWVLSPFFDERLIALEKLITAFSPRRTYLLVQSGRTSIDKKALKSLLKDRNNKIIVKTIDSSKDLNKLPGIHAKLFILKTANRSICLQGSPNCSQAALLLTPPFGNIELGNILIGERSEFDDVFENLVLTT